jgi:glycosyltransferase involved in cell wall biosynthesis
MKILIINTSNSAGGASIACFRLHNALLKQNIESDVLMLEAPNSKLNRSYSFYDFYIQRTKVKRNNLAKKSIDKIAYRLNINSEAQFVRQKAFEQKLLQQQPTGYEVFTFETSKYHIQDHPLYKQADIIHLHWVSNGFLNYQTFFKNNTKPVVWTLHDMNPFTGGCHYAESCEGFLHECADCPQLQGTADPDYASQMLHYKIKGLQGCNSLVVAAPSKWILENSKKSKVLGNFPHVHIPYGISSSNFQPRDKIYSRQLLGLPENKKVILFVSESIHKKRKGYGLLIKALQQIMNKESDLVMCAIGAGNDNSMQIENLFELGHIADEKLMSVAYSAADVFVIPSLEDNLPNTVIESLLCGTPVIGFPIGGVPEMIQHEENGYICSEVSIESLAFELQKFLLNGVKLDRNTIREGAARKYDATVQAIEYINLYKKLLVDQKFEVER